MLLLSFLCEPEKLPHHGKLQSCAGVSEMCADFAYASAMVAYLYTEYHEHQWHMPCPYEAEKAANQHKS